MALRIHALGALRIEQDGRVLDRLPARRVRCALLVYLAMEREATRDQVMGMLWPDRPPERARRLLNQALYELRQELGDELVRSSGEQLHVDGAVTVDAAEFEAAVEAGRFADAVALYAGPFLAGGPLAITRELEGWVDRQQARLVRLHRQARRGALDGLVAGGALGEALALARQWVEVDPLDDEAQHRLIELLSATGDRSGALRQYDAYAALVERELELEPLDETRELVERIRQGDVGQRTAAPLTADPAEPGMAPDHAAPEPAPPEPGAGADESRDAPPRPRPSSGAAPAGRLRRAWARLGVRRAVGYIGGIVVLTAATTLFATLDMRELPPAIAAVDGGIERPLDARRIAVLYLDDLSPQQDLKGVAAGFTEALIHELGQVEGLDVLSRTAVAPYRERIPSHDSLVATLRAGTLVQGSVTRLEDRIRVMIQLVDGYDASHIASQVVDCAPDSLTKLLEALPREVSRMLRKRLGPEIELRETRAASHSGEAWELVQRAEQIMLDAREVRWSDLEPGLELLDRADSMLARAERLDPEWPEPTIQRAGVAAQRALALAAIPSTYEKEASQTALAHLDRVLQRLPDHAPALQERGILQFNLAESGHGEDTSPLYASAEADLRRAVLLDPSLARAWWGLSQILHRKKSYAEAKRSADRALEADAFLAYSLNNLYHLFYVYFDAGEPREAVHWCDELRGRYPDTQHRAYCELLLLTSVDLIEPDVDRAWFFADTIVALATEKNRPIYRGYTALQVAKVLVRAGQLDSARAVFARVVPEPTPTWAPYDAAHLKVMLGEYEEAVEYLRLYQEWNPARARSLEADWWFEPLRGHPGFERLLGRGPG